ncbi:MAG: FAD-dependent thymidylate synthase [Myxococcota bacterium]|nr:thymidylate synthase (FAD) [Myxococcales bacterium]MEC7750017.1 FAD-dependent thymidylate synthase [Myxococcota bacterium]HBU47495.1 FAD-dependent thymidylate synthase [Myxococcales bacterium]|tara:strand:+ start:260 stop:922 length:663 start_codon:yes stop_codon:yes gene_type:complete
MVKVLDKGFVNIVDAMGNDLNVVNAARVSFGKRKQEMSSGDEKLVRYLWRHEHTSPFRHATVQFHLKAPVFVLRQWMKHQVGCAWNEISGRYVKFDYEFYEPSNWREQHESNKQGSKGSVEDQDGASAIYSQVLTQQYEAYEALLELGVCKEQARMVMPLAMYSECYWTASLQAVMHFLRLRMDHHSQWEIQQFARAVKELVEDRFPVSLDLVPLPEDPE